MSARPANVMPSEVSILKTRPAAKKALGKTVSETETVWPKPEFVSAMFRLGLSTGED
jgi:hypothetical protein